MINFEEIKKDMSPENLAKFDLAVNKVRGLDSITKDQIMNGMESIVCAMKTKMDRKIKEINEIHSKHMNEMMNELNDSTGVTKLNSVDHKKEIKMKTESGEFKSLEDIILCKYSELKTLAKVTYDVHDDETVECALSKVLRYGTYDDGAKAICIVSKIASLHDSIKLMRVIEEM